MSGLVEGNEIFIFSTFSLLWYMVLIEVYEENVASHRSVVEKGRRIPF